MGGLSDNGAYLGSGQAVSAASAVTNLLVAYMAHGAALAWIKDAGGRYLFASPAVERQFGRPGLSMVGLTDRDLLPAPVADFLRANDLQVLATSEPLELVEEVPDRDGVVRAWFSVKFPLPSEQGVLVGGVALEITRYRRAEREKQEAEKEFRQTLDAIADMIFVKGPQSRLLWANRAFRDVYGMSNEQLCGIIDAPFTEPDQTQKYVMDDRRVFQTGQPLDIPDEPLTRHDGKVLRVHTVKSPIFDSAGKV